jgi:hypothetical protein
MAELPDFTVVTYERKPGQWRAAVTPIRKPGTQTSSKTTSSIVTPKDFPSEAEAKLAGERIGRSLHMKK